MKKFAFGIIVYMVLASTSFAETGQMPAPEAVLRGQQVYIDHCLRCHRENGLGENIPIGILLPGFIPAMPLNESSHAWHHGDAQLAQTIRKGNQRMPAFESALSSQQIIDVIAYIKSLWGPRTLACQGPKHMSCM